MSQSTPGNPLPNPRRGDVYWVRVPEAHTKGSEQHDSDNGNPRLYVVLSRNSANEKLNSIVGVPLSTRLHKKNNSYRPLINAADFIDTRGELSECIAMADHIREVSVERFEGKAGRVTTYALGIIENAVAYLLQLEP